MPQHSIRIDALRGIAVLMVFQRHIFGSVFAYDYLQLPDAAAQLLLGGTAGVDLFFILSAYLLTANLLRRSDRPGGIQAFFLRRALRILPMFLVLIFCGFTLEALWLRAGGSPDTWLWGGRYPLSTYLLFLQNWRYGLDGSFSAAFFAPTWSLAVEEHFYLLLPLIATRLEPRRLALLAVTWIFIAVPIRLCLLLELGGIAPASWTIGNLDAFGCGILIALAPTLWPDLPKRLDPRLAILAGCGLFVVVVLFAPYLLPGGRNDNVFSETWIDSGLGLVTFGVANLGPAPRHPSVLTRMFAWCGLRSYSLYLLHMPILGLIFMAAGQIGRPVVGDLATLGLAVFAGGLTLVVADFCYRRVERPFIDLAGRWTLRPGRGAEAIAVAPAE